MIDFNNIEIDEISLGTIPVVEITLGDISVWPLNYTYTLTCNSVSYSTAQQRLLANGTNYCQFLCTYNKYNATTGSIISTESVTAIPSATYFETTGTNLSFDFNDCSVTRVSLSGYTAHLTYGGASTDASFNFEGNTYDSSYHNVVAPVLSSSLVDASGGIVTFTGGTYDLYRDWTSGASQAIDTNCDMEFSTPASNSSYPTVHADMYYEATPKRIEVESLRNCLVSAQSSYTFQSTVPTGITVTVNQKKNTRVSGPTTIWKAKNARTQEYFDQSERYQLSPTYDGTDTYGSIVINIDTVVYSKWESTYEQYTNPSTIDSSADIDVIIVDDESRTLDGNPTDYSGCIIGYSVSDNGTIVLSYSTYHNNPNNGDPCWYSEVIIHSKSGQYGTAVYFEQNEP